MRVFEESKVGHSDLCQSCDYRGFSNSRKGIYFNSEVATCRFEMESDNIKISLICLQILRMVKVPLLFFLLVHFNVLSYVDNLHKLRIFFLFQSFGVVMTAPTRMDSSSL